FNHEDVQGYRVNVRISEMTLTEVLDIVLNDKPLQYEVLSDHIVISPRDVTSSQRVEMLRIKGQVTDNHGNPLPGVTVMLKGTQFGTATDADGKYELDIQREYATMLVFSFIGMQTQEVAIEGRTEINVRLEEEAAQLEDVVVTGIFTKSRESYTGAVTNITSKELKMFKGQNLLSTLKNIDPAFNIVSNNALGSNPNALPEINIRGNSSLPMSMDELNNRTSQQLNAPLIIMDGFEITLEKLMDFNDEEIANINIMKDAAATAIYGSRGANGVIVITTKAPVAGKMKIFAQAGISLEIPDLSSYDLLNAGEKLALEKEAGLYEGAEGNPHNVQSMEEKYYATLADVLRGVDTYWLSEPVRTGVGQKYNLRLEGGSSEFRWGASVAYNGIQGAMKDSKRNTFSGSVTLAYSLRNVIFRNQTILDYNNSSESKYGSFSQYTQMNPYWTTKDENGDYVQSYRTILGTTVSNPLYDASLNVFDKSKYERMTNNFSIEWDIITGLKARGQVGISKEHNNADKFLPAEHSSFNSTAEWNKMENFFRKGSYTYSMGEYTNLESRVTVSYSQTFAEKHSLYVGLDWSLRNSKRYGYTIEAEGFSNEDFSFLSNALQYAREKSPTGSEDLSRQVGFTGNVNYTYDNRYYADFSYRIDGSSQFGSKNKFAPFWSAGIGWNIHREKFLADNEVVNQLRLRGSYGKTGSQQFSAYQALRTYEYYTDKRYLYWNGASLKGLGNENLKWQVTDQVDGGIEIGLWQNKLSVTFDIYSKVTSNLLSQMDLPLANGFSSYTDNVGKVKNTGYEVSVSGYVIRNTEKDMVWMLIGKLAYTKNKITKLSEAIKRQSEEYKKKNVEINSLLYEGYSQYAIYAVPSLGIDPSTGKELFLDAEGNVTTTWQPSAKQYFGQTEPKYRGNISSLFAYKDFSLNLSFGFHWGGQQYNETLLQKVEVTTSQMQYNVDRRVWSERWHQPGDLKPFKKYGSDRTRASSRFVMDDRVFELQSASLQYRWHSAFVKRLSLESVNFNVNMSDIFYVSSIKRERGTSYPFARRVEMSVGLIF
ncbi:MAG: SusC/RagA family TonB-linked outer membrane protein, partial [Odoribacter sp.]|nr:SusC/RagA family TonB-linked outer membrane protein [Odoribacter sp.]